MTKIEAIEKEVKTLSPQELTKFRSWFAEYDAELWDEKIESDAKIGRLEGLAADALAGHSKGDSTAL